VKIKLLKTLKAKIEAACHHTENDNT